LDWLALALHLACLAAAAAILARSRGERTTTFSA